MRQNTCILRKARSKEAKLPALLYGYLALCKDLKHKKSEIDKKAVVILGNLPFVSDMTKKSSPEGVRYACWSFLRY